MLKSRSGRTSRSDDPSPIFPVLRDRQGTVDGGRRSGASREPEDHTIRKSREKGRGKGWPADLTWYKLLTDWGSVIGGGFALIAGGTAYIAGRVQASATRLAAKMQVEAEQRRDDREVDTLRKSLAIEIRQLIGRAFAAHNLLKRLATTATADNPITARVVESSSRVPAAVVYPNSASKIGLLGGQDAMDIVIVYGTIEIACGYLDQLLRSRTPDNITPVNVAAVADAFLKSCQYAAREVLPKFKTGLAVHDDKDAALLKKITDATAEWETTLKNWPKMGFENVPR
jgi:hypothetical protein